MPWNKGRNLSNQFPPTLSILPPILHRTCSCAEGSCTSRYPAKSTTGQFEMMFRYWKAWVWPHSNHTGNHNLVQTNLLVHPGNSRKASSGVFYRPGILGGSRSSSIRGNYSMQDTSLLHLSGLSLQWMPRATNFHQSQVPQTQREGRPVTMLHGSGCKPTTSTNLEYSPTLKNCVSEQGKPPLSRLPANMLNSSPPRGL